MAHTAEMEKDCQSIRQLTYGRPRQETQSSMYNRVCMYTCEEGEGVVCVSEGVVCVCVSD